MNSCRASHPEMSPERFTVASIAPFSTSQQIHCSLVVCDSEWVTIAVHSTFLNIHRSGKLYSPVWLLHDWCHVKLLPSGRTFCDPTNHAPVYSVTYSEAFFFLFLLFSFFLFFTTLWWNEYGNKSQHRKLTRENCFSRCHCWQSNPQTFDHALGVLPLSCPRPPWWQLHLTTVPLDWSTGDRWWRQNTSDC